MKFKVTVGFIICIGVFTIFTIWLLLIDLWQTDDTNKTILSTAISLIGAISGLLTLVGVRLTLTSQIEKENNRRVEENKRILLTNSYKTLYGTLQDTAYYSFTRYGGAEIITNCHFKITVGTDSSFKDFDVIETWIDYFEKDEELLIPICSDKLKILKPWVIDIRATFYTINNDKIEFIQSEVDNTRNHIFYYGETQQSIGFNTNYTAWTQKQK